MKESWEQYRKYSGELRFLFIHPGHLFGRFANIPLGIATLAAILEELGYYVRCKDYLVEPFIEEDLYRIIEEQGINVVGFSSMTRQVVVCYEMIELLRARFPKLKIVIGGHHPTIKPEEALDYGVDLVYRGDGEETLLRTLEHLAQDEMDYDALSQVPGLAFRHEDKNVVTPKAEPFTDLESLPIPARHLFEHFPERYRTQLKINNGYSAHVITSRGCIGRCFFCSNIPRAHSIRSPRRIVEEMVHLKNDFNIENIFIQDDLPIPAPQHMIEICDEIRRQGLEVDWAVSNTRAEGMTYEMFKRMKECGCIGVSFGIESGDPVIHKKIGKLNSLEDVEKAVRGAKKAGLLVGGFYIFGFPFETKENMRTTLAFAKRLNTPLATFAVLCPFPGSPAYRYLKKKGKLKTEDWNEFSTHNKTLLYESDNFTGEWLTKFRWWAYLSYYLSPRYIAQLIPLVLKNFKPAMWWEGLKFSLQFASNYRFSLGGHKGDKNVDVLLADKEEKYL